MRRFISNILFSAIMMAFSVAIIAMLCTACNSKNDKNSQFSADFVRMSDSEKVAFMMQNVSPDSVARFICDATLGNIEGVKVDSISNAVLYAYGHYKSEADMQTFSSTLDDYVASLPLDKRMRIMKMLGEIDAQALGYQLGLEYVDHIRIDNMTPEQVKAEISAFKTACGADSMMYQRFLTGFKVALEIDKGKDLPADIYTEFKNYR